MKYEVYFVGGGGCKQFYAEAAYNYKLVTSVWEWHDDVSTSSDVAFLNDVTLMTHMSADRIQMLALLIEHWEGPLAFSVYGSFQELRNFSSKIQNYQHIMERNNHCNIDRPNVYRNVHYS